MENKDVKNPSLKKKRISYFAYDFLKITGILPVWVWLHPTVIHVGDKKSHNVKGPIMISSNHVGFRDPLILLVAFWRRRLFALITKDLYEKKGMAWMLDAIHMIKVDKENFSMQSFHKVSDHLSRGKAVLIFPEGQVNKTGSMMSFKSGAVLMAHKNHSKILPVFVKPGEKWYHKNYVLVGDPIDVREICGAFPSMDKLQTASDYIHEHEKELENYFNEHILKKDNIN